MMERMPSARISSNPSARSSSPGDSPLIGIDPGLQRTGYAVVRPRGCEAELIEAGVVRLGAGLPLEARLAELERGLDELISATQPGCLVCEELYAHYRHPRTAILMAHARGVVLALAARRGLEVCGVAATQVKKLLTGSGRAGKAQMQRAITAALRLDRPPEPHDVSDAIAIALCGQRLRAAHRRLASAASIARTGPNRRPA
jgi:crossover junction endodeoxyribonuclease RuvC